MRKFFRLSFVLLLLALFVFANFTHVKDINAQDLKQQNLKIKSNVELFLKDKQIPALVLAILPNGAEKASIMAFGKTSLELDVAVKTEDVFCFGSVTKVLLPCALRIMQKKIILI